MPAIPRDWADPFLEQSREDLHAAWAVRSAEDWEQSASTFCMLLQMVFEKLAKAYYARNGTVAASHRAASHLFAILKRHPSGTRLLAECPSVEQFVMQLEAAQPSVAGRQMPCLEYPWEDVTSGTVRWPGRHLPLVHRVKDPRDRVGLDCLRFASALEKQIDAIAP
jgi:hypothetical protein